MTKLFHQTYMYFNTHPVHLDILYFLVVNSKFISKWNQRGLFSTFWSAQTVRNACGYYAKKEVAAVHFVNKNSHLWNRYTIVTDS